MRRSGFAVQGQAHVNRDSRERDQVVFRTGLLYEADLVAATLAENGIPHYRRSETVGGIQWAMPAGPTQGPGEWWLILVPADAAERARELIQELPVSREPSAEVWAFQPTPRAKRIWRLGAAVALGFFALALLNQLIQLIGERKGP